MLGFLNKIFFIQVFYFLNNLISLKKTIFIYKIAEKIITLVVVI